MSLCFVIQLKGFGVSARLSSFLLKITPQLFITADHLPKHTRLEIYE